jgi:hypothetical protein
LESRCEVFLGSMGSLTSPYGSASGLRPVARGFACAPPYALTPGRPPPGRAALLRHPFSLPTPGSVRPPAAPPRRDQRPAGSASPVSAWAIPRGYGNINPLSIDYACRPRLRPRLTLGGLACPRNPWSSGGGVSRPSFATHACILTRDASTAGFPRRFARDTTLPYPPAPRAGAAASAACLSPVTLSARNHLTSELLRTLSRVAASKPTSWLSVQLHILSHLAHA